MCSAPQRPTTSADHALDRGRNRRRRPRRRHAACAGWPSSAESGVESRDRGRGRLGVPPVVDHDGRAFPGEEFGHGAADAARSAGHQRDAAFQAMGVPHSALPPQTTCSGASAQTVASSISTCSVAWPMPNCRAQARAAGHQGDVTRVAARHDEMGRQRRLGGGDRPDVEVVQRRRRPAARRGSGARRRARSRAARRPSPWWYCRAAGSRCRRR